MGRERRSNWGGEGRGRAWEGGRERYNGRKTLEEREMMERGTEAREVKSEGK